MLMGNGHRLSRIANVANCNQPYNLLLREFNHGVLIDTSSPRYRGDPCSNRAAPSIREPGTGRTGYQGLRLHTWILSALRVSLEKKDAPSTITITGPGSAAMPKNLQRSQSLARARRTRACTHKRGHWANVRSWGYCGNRPSAGPDRICRF
jgi:hypothetical protein